MGEGDEEEEQDADEGAKQEEKEGEEEGEDKKDGRPRGPTPLYSTLKEVGPLAGKLAELEGTHMYHTGKAGSVVGILLISDLWGWNSGRVRAVADYFAKTLNAFAVVPRLLDKPTYEGGTDGDGLPPGFDPASHRKELRAWLLRYVWQSFRPRIDAAAVFLRNSGVKRLAGVGFCFGAWAVAKAGIGEAVCNAFFYPSIHLFEELTDGDAVRLAGKVRGPSLFMPAGDDPVMYGPGGDVFEAALYANPDQAETLPFPEMAHDWVLRGDISDTQVDQAVVQAVTAAARYMRKFLWPPPAGANAATLRLLCQQGDADMVSELLSAGVPAHGKDAADIVGLKPLHYAARSANNVQPLRILVEYEADVNCTGGIGFETPLHVATSLGNLKASKTLLQLKADTNKADKGGQTPLHHAAKLGHLALVKQLLGAKASMHARDTPSEQTPLHLAAWFGMEEIVLHLLRAKMDVDPEDLRSMTPQKRAEQQGFKVVAQILEAERARREEEAYDAQHTSPPGGSPYGPGS